MYASDSRTSAVVCTAAVTGTTWSCAGTVPAGHYLVSALQRDAAGNVSGGSNSFGLTVAVPAPSGLGRVDARSRIVERRTGPGRSPGDRAGAVSPLRCR